jgi:hypothetical protein
MADYVKVDKETSDYTKVEKATGKGWFQLGWFRDWFRETFLYHRTEKEKSLYTKVDKE